MKKLISIILIIILSFSIMVTTVHAETITGKCGETSYYTFDSETNTITISGTGSIDYWEHWTNISSRIVYASKIIIEDGITKIGKHAFREMSILDIQIPNSVKSIGIESFSMCFDLKSISLPMYLENIDERAFEYCSSITEIDVPSTVTTISSYAFSMCTSLKKIVLPDNFTAIPDSLFYGCSSLSEFNISEKINKIGHTAFAGCISLGSLTIPESISEIGYEAFFDCGFKSVTIPKSVTRVGDYAFGYTEDDNGTPVPIKDFTINCYNNSNAYYYAIYNGFNYNIIDKNDNSIFIKLWIELGNYINTIINFIKNIFFIFNV